MSPDDHAQDAASRLWAEHEDAEFPALGGDGRGGIDLVLLDADVAGCVLSWLDSSGRLDPASAKIVAACLSDLDRVLPLLTDEQEVVYFRRLRKLATMVLAS
jgi:hypothetical protein